MSNKLTLAVLFQGVDKMSPALRNIVGLGNKGSSSIKALSGEARKLSAELRGVQRELGKGSGNVTELVNRERQLEQQMRGVNEQIERRKRIAAFKADTAAMARQGDQLKTSGRDNIVGGAGLAAPMILAVKSAADFSSGMVDIQQKSELSEEATARLGNRITVLARTAKQMPEDMRAGLDVLLSKGMNLDAATDAIGPAGRLATAYKVDLTDAADAAFASISNLKVASGESARIFDTMAAAGNAGGFEVRDMARHFPSLTAQMQALGEQGVPAVADLSAALQVAMYTAGNADEAGNNIQNLLGKINAPGTISAFKKNFGIDLPTAMKKLTDEGHSSMEAIALITKQATGGDMKKLGFAFEDQQARMGLLALIQNLDEYRDIRRQALTSGGTVDKAFDQRVAGDATVQWKAFMGTASSLAIVLGTTVLPVMTDVMGYLVNVGNSVASWAQANPELAGSIMKGVAAFAAFRIGLGVMQFGLGSIISTVANARTVFGQARGIFGGLRSAVIFLGKGFMRAGMMMLANPIVLIIAAVVAAVGIAAYLIYTHWDKISAVFTAGVKWVKDTLQGLPDWLKSIGSMMMQGLLMAINPMALASKLLDVARNGITAFKNYFGIKSPSRLFMAMGGHLTTGLERGINRNSHAPVRAIGRMATGVAAAGAISLTPMQAAARPGGGTATSQSAAPIHVHVYGTAGMSTDDLAEAVMRKIERAKAASGRRTYEER